MLVPPGQPMDLAREPNVLVVRSESAGRVIAGRSFAKSFYGRKVRAP